MPDVALRQITLFPFLTLTDDTGAEDQIYNVHRSQIQDYEHAVEAMQAAELALLESIAPQIGKVIRTVPMADDKHGRNLRTRAIQLNNRIIELRSKLKG